MSARDEWATPLTGQRNAWFLKKIEPNLKDVRSRLLQSDELIDVGCGEGHFYPALRHERYMGIDLYPENVAIARSLFSARFECMDLFDLDGTWDVVLCSRVVIHLNRFDEAIRKLISCSKRLCILIVAVGIDSVSEENYKRQLLRFRTFSPQTLSEFGACEIIKHPQYATVIYGR